MELANSVFTQCDAASLQVEKLLRIAYEGLKVRVNVPRLKHKVHVIKLSL